VDFGEVTPTQDEEGPTDFNTDSEMNELQQEVPAPEVSDAGLEDGNGLETAGSVEYETFPEENSAQLPGDTPGDQPASEPDLNTFFTVEEVSPLEMELENEPLEAGYELASPGPVQEEDSPEVSGEPVPADTGITLSPVPVVRESTGVDASRKIALILSGGGARGAFQVGAEMYARQVKGYHWDIIAGVSVGAMNGAMLSMHRFNRLLEIWQNITDAQVYRGGFNLPSIVKLIFGSKSFYSNQPLQEMMRHEFEAGQIIDDLHVGAVSLITGEYVQFTKDFLELPAAILASASIPVIWPPVDISPDHLAMVDGGVRNINPVGDVLDLEPDEIVIINCSRQRPPLAPQSADTVLSIGMRALDIMQNEIFINDVKEFLSINALVKEAADQGVVLHHQRTGRPLKYYPCTVIEPDIELGETLDFSQSSVQAALRAGVRCARAALGRP
jgi:NTE family protein